MDIKLVYSEMDDMMDLLARALNAVIAEFLNVDVASVHPDARLVADLGMSPAARKRLQKEISFLFDCAEIDMPDGMKVEELVAEVATIEFSRLEPNLSAQVA